MEPSILTKARTFLATYAINLVQRLRDNKLVAKTKDYVASKQNRLEYRIENLQIDFYFTLNRRA